MAAGRQLIIMWLVIWSSAVVISAQSDSYGLPEQLWKDCRRRYQGPVSRSIEAAGARFHMCLIPPGCFWMGSSPGERGRFTNEGPMHRVVISQPFWMGRYEVTCRQWRQVTGEKPWDGKARAKDAPDYPACYVSWNDINELFLPRLDGKFALPTEAQWEYACRAGAIDRFYWGEDRDYRSIGRYAWYNKNAYRIGKGHAQRVGQKEPNAWGLYDMSGNVYEWCADRYTKEYPDYEVVDPPAGIDGYMTTGRSGSWRDVACGCRSARRCMWHPDHRNYSIGLRLVTELPK